MTDAATMTGTREIIVDEVLPHAAEVVWKTLTTPALMSRWLKMAAVGFEAVVGNPFTYQTTPAGNWDGVIHCRVLDVVPNERLVYAWRGGDDGNVGYGSRLDTVVTWTLSEAPGGVRVRLVHSGFELPRNETAFNGMSRGWSDVLKLIDSVAAD